MNQHSGNSYTESIGLGANSPINILLNSCQTGLIIAFMDGFVSKYFNRKVLNFFKLNDEYVEKSSLGSILDSLNGTSPNGTRLRKENYPIWSSLYDGIESNLTFHKTINGVTSVFLMKSSFAKITEIVTGVIATVEDITETTNMHQKFQDATFRLENLWRLSSQESITIKEVCDLTLEAIVNITKSQYGFYGFISDDGMEMIIHAWSGETMKGCSIIDKPFVYSIEHAGIWAEAVRRRRPLIINDYSTCGLNFKGYPAGHVKLFNLMVIPHFIGQKLHSIAAVANKNSDYRETDVTTVTNFLNDIHSIIKRLEVERQLKSSEEKYRNLINKMNEGVLILNESMIVTYVNNKLCQLLDFDTEDILDHYFYNFVYKDNIREFINQQELRKQGLSDSYEMTLKNKNGDVIFVLSSPTPIFNDDNTFQGSYEIITDITKLKTYESVIIKEKESAIAANMAKSEFLANMSHEIRTPFNGIMGMLQLCQSTDLTDEQKEYVTLALDSTRKLLSIINDILDLARIEKGQQYLCAIDFNIALMLNDLSALFNSQIKEKHLTLRCLIHDSVPEIICADETKIRQILFNLIGNAIKFTTEGEIIVDISCISKDIDHKQIKLLFVVSDTGCGISDKDFPRLFKPFSQADGSSSRKYQGAGLGLSIVKRLIELMNGTICVSSEIGSGTDIFITLDINLKKQNDNPINIHHLITPYTRRYDKVNILLAEDEIVNQLGIKKFIEKIGWNIDIAKNGHEALQLLENNNYDIILMDIQMPQLDGINTTKLIRSSGTRYKNIPIIALTAHALVGDKERFLETGMDDYIPKPVEFDILLNVVEANLTKKIRIA